nr:MAG TPA: hypothetical protein [Caudoviricetes sp.]
MDKRKITRSHYFITTISIQFSLHFLDQSAHHFTNKKRISNRR